MLISESAGDLRQIAPPRTPQKKRSWGWFDTTFRLDRLDPSHVRGLQLVSGISVMSGRIES